MVVTGGRQGVAAAVCRGAVEAGGLTVGILPGRDRAEANPWVTVAVPTGLGETRNALVVMGADAVIAFPGVYGTLSEVAFALLAGTPVVGLGTWTLDPARRQSRHRCHPRLHPRGRGGARARPRSEHAPQVLNTKRARRWRRAPGRYSAMCIGTRTQPCEAGPFGTDPEPCMANPP